MIRVTRNAGVGGSVVVAIGSAAHPWPAVCDAL